MTVLDGLAESELQAFRKLPDFVLRHTSHDDQPKFTIAIQCVDVIILEQYAHIVVQQLLCILMLSSVLRENGYFFVMMKSNIPRLASSIMRRKLSRL